MNAINGFVYIGMHNNKAIILVAKKFLSLTGTESLRFTGTIKKIPSEDSINTVKNYLEVYDMPQEYMNALITDVYVEMDAENYSVTKQKKPIGNDLLGFALLWMPLLFICIVVKDIYRIVCFWRRSNRF
jgi:hypothetical protein